MTCWLNPKGKVPTLLIYEGFSSKQGSMNYGWTHISVLLESWRASLLDLWCTSAGLKSANDASKLSTTPNPQWTRRCCSHWWARSTSSEDSSPTYQEGWNISHHCYEWSPTKSSDGVQSSNMCSIVSRHTSVHHPSYYHIEGSTILIVSIGWWVNHQVYPSARNRRTRMGYFLLKQKIGGCRN